MKQSFHCVLTVTCRMGLGVEFSICHASAQKVSDSGVFWILHFQMKDSHQAV